MKIYHFIREDGKATVWVETDRSFYPLPHLIAHSTTGMDWGFGGKGPADTALSMLADYFQEYPQLVSKDWRETRSWLYHQDFKWAFLSNATLGETFTIAEERIKKWMEMSEGKTP